MMKFVICGIEHSGTTLVSDLFRQVPHIDAGFEVGVLLGESPREFVNISPFFENAQGGWGVTAEELTQCCDTDSFDEFYDRLKACSTILKSDTEVIFDKTPRYLACLSQCMAKVAVPFIVTYRDPRAIVYSDFTRSREQDFDKWFPGYVGGKRRYMRTIYGEYCKIKDNPDAPVLMMPLERLCLEVRTSCERLFSHVGYSFEYQYLLFNNLRYHHTRSTSVSARIPFEYLEGLTHPQLQLIEKEFGEFEDWFYR